MFRDALSTLQRWNYRDGRPSWTARASNRLNAIAFAAGIGPRHAATLEVRGRKTGRTISFPVVVADYKGGRYLVAMLGQKTEWAANLRADDHAVLLTRRQREGVSLVEDFSDDRAAILRRYLELAPGARPFFPVDRHSPLGEFAGIVNDYPVFRVA
ncbi:nitroreductase/quinone reductase family protein [Mycolicibacterium stellerae]|uniref:nitroreductase/quinone reductase family protein n=1 Tax=Mycolicibacterium stellerae TaxID=2358193 RepID=UPI000F0B22AA|nr:nitroreductase/quinone reductase family protein [Mycolicibacterium stellerae]